MNDNSMNDESSFSNYTGNIYQKSSQNSFYHTNSQELSNNIFIMN